MNVLIACEKSGEVRRAFAALGHNAWSCDLQAAEDNSRLHFQMDARQVAYGGLLPGVPWDLIILHPPCTYLSVSGIHWNKRRPERALQTEAAMHFVHDLVAACGDTPFALENPVSIISTHWRKPDQIIQPYQFGHDASKATCLWLQGLPALTIDPTLHVMPRAVCQNPECRTVERGNDLVARAVLEGCIECDGRCLPRWANPTDSGQNKLPPSASRAVDRARTYPGIARAMARQWSDFLLNK